MIELTDEQFDQLVEDRLRIEVFLRLVDDQRAVIAVVQGKIEQQQDDAARARRELADIDGFVVDTVADLDMAGAVNWHIFKQLLV